MLLTIPLDTLPKCWYTDAVKVTKFFPALIPIVVGVGRFDLWSFRVLRDQTTDDRKSWHLEQFYFGFWGYRCAFAVVVVGTSASDTAMPSRFRQKRIYCCVWDEWHSLCLRQEASFGGGGGKHSQTRFSQYTDCFFCVFVGSTLKNNVIIGKWNERVPGVSSILVNFEFACVPVLG